MEPIEFSTDHSTGQAMFRVIGEPCVNELTQKDTEVIRRLLDISETFYPEQYEALNNEYKSSSLNKPYFDFLRARRMVNCCFGELDSKIDLDQMGCVNFEYVKCPRMAECKYYKIICQPKFNSTLSEREQEVMKLYFMNTPTEMIAEKLFISIHTVNNHRKNSLAKLGLHSMEEFIGYAHKNKLFEL